ncbi:MAG: 3-isopropylmalate dehydratase large subunit [candidate division Zixibacteria bacterium CG_4_9_14_3_um_filter_46_8]|nr:MAG: 3-isopropylmalate dehydratase large subunit [candidate division Zixibacteria bacterium CG_4_9_14_3_um_filter_46_8]
MGLTFAEKILSAKAGKKVIPGEIVEITPDLAMSHDNTSAISKTFYEIGVDKVFDPDIHIVILDHCSPAATEKYAQNHKIVREFVKKQGIKKFYDINAGICHQVIAELGLARPGTVIVGSDSHTTHLGAFGAFSTGISRSEMAVIMATGKIWLRVPESMRVILLGMPPKTTFAKDVALFVVGQVGADGAIYRSIEFSGPYIDSISMDYRVVFTNLSVEMGAKIGYVKPDERTFSYLSLRSNKSYQPVYSDSDANYVQDIDLDISNLPPQVACPHAVDNVKSVEEVVGTKINQAFLGTCNGSRLVDWKVFALILKGRKVHPDCRLICIPASTQVYLDSLKAGYISTILEAGGVITNSGCGPCLGAHQGIPAPDEVVISTANRNFKGRMGSRDAQVYLASPATVAASAVKGQISDPREFL